MQGEIRIPALLDVRFGSGLLLIAAVGVLARLSDAGAVLPKQEGDAAARETEQGKQGRGPLVAHAVVHLLGEQDDGSAPEGADARLCRQGRSGLVLVRVNQVVVGRVVEEEEAEADRETSEAGADPGQAGVRGPGKDEEADGDEPAAEHHGDQASLGRGLAVVLGDLLEVVAVDEGGADGGENNAHSDGDEHEAGGAGRVTLADLEDDGVGDEEHVEKAIEDRHVDRDEEDDEFAEEELEGADQKDGDALRERPGVELGLGDVPAVAGLLAKLLGPRREDGRSVSFGHGEGDDDPDDKGKYELNPVEPSPACGVGEETANERTNRGTHEWSGREGSHRHTTLLIAPEISKSTTDQGHWCGESNAVDQSADDEGADVLSNSAWDDENHSDKESGGTRKGKRGQ